MSTVGISQADRPGLEKALGENFHDGRKFGENVFKPGDAWTVVIRSLSVCLSVCLSLIVLN